VNEHKIAYGLAIFFGFFFLGGGLVYLWRAAKTGIVETEIWGKVSRTDHPVIFVIGVVIWVLIVAMGILILWLVAHTTPATD
jgi:hypothetical protein